MKNIINAGLILGGYVLPYLILRSYQNSFNIEIIQAVVFIVLLIAACFLTRKNYYNLKQAQKNKWWWVIFVLVGVAGILLSVGILLLLFSLRHCCGF
jgi:4-amino-4-deoxy-L-arabinose transferase-like glycosyltransferase